MCIRDSAMAGEAYLKSKNPRAKEALELLGKARDIDPKIAKYWIRLGDAYFLNNDLGNAMTCLLYTSRCV